MSHELRNAFELSRREYINCDESPAIDRLVGNGKAVVFVDTLIHCRFTDAVINSERHVVSVHDDLAEALAEAEDLMEDGYGGVDHSSLREAPAPAPVDTDDGLCPF